MSLSSSCRMNSNDTMQEMYDKINHCVVALNNDFFQLVHAPNIYVLMMITMQTIHRNQTLKFHSINRSLIVN